MKLYDNWKDIVRKAWSIRLMVLAGVLSAVEVVLPLFADSIPRGTFAALSGVTVAAAFVARLVAQQDIE
jgi:hypothetical protein